MVALATDSDDCRTQPGGPVDRLACWLPVRPGGYRVYFRTAERQRVPVSVIHSSLREVRLAIEHAVDLTLLQPVVLVSGKRLIMGTVQRTKRTVDGASHVDIALIWCSMATRRRALTEEHEVLVSF
jgi:hypothetical protein